MVDEKSNDAPKGDGEPKLSKNELKRRLKAEKLAKKKAEKEAARKAAAEEKLKSEGKKVDFLCITFNLFLDRI